MKRILALILVLCLCIPVLAGCSDNNASTTTADTGFTWNGKKEIWSVLPTMDAEGLVMINEAMGEIMKADGWTHVMKDAEVTPANQVTIIEDAIASGNVGALMVAAMSTEMIESAVKDAIAAGIIVIFLGAEPSYQIAGEVYTAYEITGAYAVEAAESWAKANNPPADANGVPVAINIYEDIIDGRYRSNGFRDTVAASDTLYSYNEQSIYGKTAQTEGYNWAENMMTRNADLRIFLCYEPDAAYGVCNYLATYAADNGLDLADFCVICCYEDDDTPVLLSQARSDPSSTAFKGYVTYGDEGGPPVVGAKLAEEFLGIVDGSWAYGTYYYDTINAFTSFEYSNTWKMGDENPYADLKY